MAIDESANYRPRHPCHIDVENPDRIVFVEEWADLDSVRAHFAVPASQAFVADMRRLSPEPPLMRIFSAEDVTAEEMGQGEPAAHAK